MPVHTFPSPPLAGSKSARSPTKKAVSTSPVKREDHLHSSGSSSSTRRSSSTEGHEVKGSKIGQGSRSAGDDPLLLTSSLIMESEEEELVGVDRDDDSMDDETDSDGEDNTIVVNGEIHA